MSIVLILSHSFTFAVQNGDSGTSSPQGGGENKPLTSSAFKRGTSSINNRSFNNLRDRRLLTLDAKLSSISIFFSINKPRLRDFSPSPSSMGVKRSKSLSFCTTFGVAMM
uniref:Uncharacterized protein n=1 Tax=Opuntia streptacantha TaxID=393608 RepID=A0A7C8YKJ1_OPUST